MKTPTQQNQMVCRPFVFAALLAGILLVPAGRAPAAATKANNRVLLIFDTSSDMKQCLPAVQKALNNFLIAGTNGPLHIGDSIGVWTFDQELRAGQFPLQRWDPGNARIIAAGIDTFIGKQRYAKTTKFDAFMPALNQVMLNSERLTVLIFCDGDGEIFGTPYDVGINRVFNERRSERQKARLPIVIGLRSQRAQYVGCTVSFPPQPISLPQFPPLPAPPVPPPAPPPPEKPVAAAPLIIVGTTLTNRVPPPAPPAPPPEPKPTLPKPAPMTITPTSTPPPAASNEVKPPAAVSLTQTSTVPARPKIAAAPPPATNAIVPPVNNGETGHGNTFIMGVAFAAAAVAGALVGFMFRRTRKSGGDNPNDSSFKKD